jgi:hypothetical protein
MGMPDVLNLLNQVMQQMKETQQQMNDNHQEISQRMNLLAADTQEIKAANERKRTIGYLIVHYCHAKNGIQCRLSHRVC